MEIGTKKIGERVKLIVNYEIVEKTKSYTILRVHGLTVVKTKRTY
jgi:hypothetical protein